MEWTSTISEIVATRRTRRVGAIRLLERFAVEAPADLDAQLAHIPVAPLWIRLPLSLALAGGLWAILIFGAIAAARRLGI